MSDALVPADGWVIRVADFATGKTYLLHEGQVYSHRYQADQEVERFRRLSVKAYEVLPRWKGVALEERENG